MENSSVILGMYLAIQRSKISLIKEVILVDIAIYRAISASIV
jgi:hypothetical protein